MADRHTTIFGDQIDATALGAGLEKDVSDNLQVKVDDSSIEISTDTLQIKASGVTNDMLAGSIADGKLAEDYIKTSEVDDSSIEFDGGTLNVKASGVTNDMLAGSIADGKLAEDYIQTSEVDGSTIEFSGGSLNIVDNGVDTTQLADEAVTEAKLDALDTPNDGEVLSWNNGSSQFEWIAPNADGVQESDVVVNEIPSGLINSGNTDYTLANTPVSGTVAVFLNGMYQAPGSGLDYTISGTTISFSKAPHTNSDLYVTYIIDN